MKTFAAVKKKSTCNLLKVVQLFLLDVKGTRAISDYFKEEEETHTIAQTKRLT